MTLILYTLILCIACIAALSIVVATIKAGISPMPSSKRAKKAMLDLLDCNCGGKIYDLGAGWGTLLFAAAKKCPNAQIIGIENSLIPYLFAQGRRLLSQSKNVTLFYGDFFDFDLSEADYMLCYLYPKAMSALSLKFSKELKTNACIISNSFRLPAWSPKRTIPLKGILSSEIYLYLTV